MRDFLVRFEAKFLVGIRWLFTVVAILMLIGLVGSIGWFISQHTMVSSDEPKDYLQLPTWGEIRTKVLSIQPLLSQQPPSPDPDASQPGITLELEIDPNITAVVETLDGMYSRDPSWSFSKSMSATRLASWLSTAIVLSEEDRRLFNESLLTYVRTLASDPVLDRLANNQDRRKTLSQAIDEFVSEYADRRRDAERLADLARMQTEKEFATNLQLVLTISGACLVVLITLALLIVLIRTEDHLSRIAVRRGD